jgi:hypothetical protein
LKLSVWEEFRSLQGDFVESQHRMASYDSHTDGRKMLVEEKHSGIAGVKTTSSMCGLRSFQNTYNSFRFHFLSREDWLNRWWCEG